MQHTTQTALKTEVEPKRAPIAFTLPVPQACTYGGVCCWVMDRKWCQSISSSSSWFGTSP